MVSKYRKQFRPKLSYCTEDIQLFGASRISSILSWWIIQHTSKLLHGFPQTWYSCGGQSWWFKTFSQPMLEQRQDLQLSILACWQTLLVRYEEFSLVFTAWSLGSFSQKQPSRLHRICVGSTSLERRHYTSSSWFSCCYFPFHSKSQQQRLGSFLQMDRSRGEG